jgi:acetyltransferase-like isoleucine patch superfamily enzyme
MNNKEIIFVPKLGVNDDEVLISEIHATNLETVKTDQLLFVLESMKTSEEVLSPCDGVLRFNVFEGQKVRVGSQLCIIFNDYQDGLDYSFDEINDEHNVSEIIITAQAKLLLDKHNIDPKELGIDLIRENDVKSYINKFNLIGGENLLDDLEFDDKSLVLIGAKSFSSSIISILSRSYEYSVVGILVSPKDESLIGTHFHGIEIIGTDDFFTLTKLYSLGLKHVFLAYGSFFSLPSRLDKYNEVTKIGFILPVIIHPSSVIGDFVTLGQGTYIGPLANIGNNVTIGANSIVLDSVILAHDSIIKENVYLSPGCILAGGVEVGVNSIIGMGVTIYLGIKIGDNSIINNGINVFENVNSKTILKK